MRKPTLNGATLTAERGRLVNGYIHGIDRVLIPVDL